MNGSTRPSSESGDLSSDCPSTDNSELSNNSSVSSLSVENGGGDDCHELAGDGSASGSAILRVPKISELNNTPAGRSNYGSGSGHIVNFAAGLNVGNDSLGGAKYNVKRKCSSKAVSPEKKQCHEQGSDTRGDGLGAFGNEQQSPTSMYVPSVSPGLGTNCHKSVDMTSCDHPRQDNSSPPFSISSSMMHSGLSVSYDHLLFNDSSTSRSDIVGNSSKNYVASTPAVAPALDPALGVDWPVEDEGCVARAKMFGMDVGNSGPSSSHAKMDCGNAGECGNEDDPEDMFENIDDVTEERGVPEDVKGWIDMFSKFSSEERRSALTALIPHCDASLIVHIERQIEPHFTRDFISLLPKELALFVFSLLSAHHLLIAAQVSREWRTLSEDLLLWQEICAEESITLDSLPPEPQPVSDDLIRPSVLAVGGRSTPHSRPFVHDPRPAPATSANPRTADCRTRCPLKATFVRYDRIRQNWKRNRLPKPKHLRGHEEHVITCLQLNGRYIISGSDDNTLKVWYADTAECLYTLTGHTGGVWASEVDTARLRIVASGSTDRTVRVWDLDTGRCRFVLTGHTSTVRCMALKNTVLVSGSRDMTIRVWDLAKGALVCVLAGHGCAVRCVAFDGQRVVSGAYDCFVKVWDVATATCVHTLEGHSNRVYSLQFDPLQNIVVSGSLDTDIRVWDVRTGKCLNRLSGHTSLNSDIQLRKNILVSGNADSTTKIWDIYTGQCLHTLAGENKHHSSITCLQYLEYGLVATSSDDGTVKLWNANTGEFIRNLVTLETGGQGGVVWRIQASQSMIVCAVGSRNSVEDTKLIVLDFNVAYT